MSPASSGSSPPPAPPPPAPPPLAPLLSRRALNRALLARQGLLERRDIPVLGMIEHLVGLQSQAVVPPYLGLASRVEGFAPSDLSDLIDRRQAVRMSTLRGTIHLVGARDAAEQRPLLQTMTERAFRSTFRRSLPGVDLDAVTRLSRDLVEDQPRTFAELGRLLAPRWPQADPAALAQIARARLPLVQVTPRGLWGRGGSARHTTLEHWTGIERVEHPDPAQALDRLVLRYLGAFGPAAVKDAQAWSGLTRLGEVLDRLRPRLLCFVDDRGVELFDLPDAPRPDPDIPVPVRLVAPFDNLVLSHGDRSRALGDLSAQHLFSVNGLIPGTVLVDGFVDGTWRLRQDRGSSTIEVTPLSRWSRAVLTDVQQEAERLLRTFGTGDLDIVIAEATIPPRR